MDVTIVSVPVSDQDAALRFWTEQVGLCLLVESRFGPGTRWLQVGRPGAATTLTLVTWFDAMPPGSLQGVVFEVDDVRAAHQRLQAAGVPFDGPLRSEPWGEQAAFRDPDGNGFVLSSRARVPA